MKSAKLLFALMLLLAAPLVNAQLLWKITPPAGAPESSLFATYHLAPPAVLDSVAGFHDALKKAEAVYGELDMLALSNPESMTKMAAALMAPADSTLTRILTQVQLDSLATALHSVAGDAVTIAMIDGLRPMQVATLMLVAAASHIEGYDPTWQIDREIQQMASDAGKRTAGLETLDLQIEKLFGAPISKQAMMLMRSVAEILEGSRLAELYNAYRAGDLDTLIASSQAEMTEEEQESLIYSRNKAWVEFLLGALPTASIMIAVGGAHLPGDNGLISRLRENGYKVEPYTTVK